MKVQGWLYYISADRRIGRETDGRFCSNYFIKINERITINGKVGVPFGGIRVCNCGI
jgi:hypothetical protein